jgi:hypothetical protein
MTKRYFLGGVLFLLLGLPLSAADTTPMTVAIQGTLSTPAEGLIGSRYPGKSVRKNIKITIFSGAVETPWFDSYTGVVFVNGAFSLVLGKGRTLTAADLRVPDPRFAITVDNSTAYVPISSAPYAVQSRSAESVMAIDAGVISGTFVSTVNVNAAMNVRNGTLFVSPTMPYVGVGTTSPGYPLDVQGIVNASEYRVNGVDLESAFSWQKQGSSLYYLAGNVGVGTQNPSYALDVVGTINATAFMIDGVEISQRLKAELAWQSGPGNDIYFDDGVLPNGGYVGIGTTAPIEKLDVRGGLRIGASTKNPPQAGTIQYLLDLNTQLGDFQGYNGQEWISLTGIRGSGVSGNLTFWTGDKTVAGSDVAFWNGNGMLGVGTSFPQARLHVRGSSSVDPILHVQNQAGDSLFLVNSQNVGVGTSRPTVKLDVNGNVNASAYQINGQPIEYALSSDTYWLLENSGRIFYDKGNVGVGTTSPANLLELASTTGNAAMTFDIAGQDLFTMGINSANPEAFIIAKGGDLTVPVFTFKGQNIGVGVSDPKSNLHVSGNSGIIVSGQYGSGDALLESGRGAKLLWYPNKAAFRVGYVLGLEWDQANLGDFSVGIGYNPFASGYASSVVGGFRNKATGQYSVAIGGLENEAAGDYSLAVGHFAKALHRGSFVWADYTPTSNTQTFTSSVANQFIIRAHNGVGIGTTDTSRSSLTVVNPREGDYLLNAKGVGSTQFVVTTSGNVGIGTSSPGVAGLALMGGSRMGIGTTDPQAMLTVYPSSVTPTTNVAMFKAPGVDFVSLLISPSGNVGIGVTEAYDFSQTGERLVVVGGIKATEFKMVDPNDPNQTITLQPNPGSPWADPSVNSNNTHRTQGFVGIGTPSPNSLLELSNRNASGDIPVITFDINGDDKYSLGVSTPSAAASTFLFTIQPGGRLTTTPSIVIATSSVGIGIGLTQPSVPLQVSGDAVVLGSMAVGTSSISSLYRLNVGGALNAEQVYIGGVRFEPAESPWKTQGSNIYFSSGNVGIGTSSPAYKLDVLGSIRTTDFILSNNLISLGQDLTVSSLYLKDTVFKDPPDYGRLFVENTELKYTNPSGLTKVINSPLQKGIGVNGRLAYFVDDSTVGQSDVVWDGSVPQLEVSGNLQVSRLFSSNGFSVLSGVSAGRAQSALEITATLNHTGENDYIRGFTAQNIDVTVARSWGNGSAIAVKGLDIAMRSDVNAKLLNNADAVGLRVDMTEVGVNADPSNLGKKYAAIFLGGNVGIGTTEPSSELEVIGIVSANYFNLSGGLIVSGSASLTVPSLVVTGGSPLSDTFVARSVLSAGKYLPRVGIGITDPENGSSELMVNGTISANQLVLSGGLTATTVNVANNGFVVDASGNIGIGTSLPNGQIEMYRRISGVQTQETISQKMGIVIDGAAPGSVFSLDKNITGVNVALSTAALNKLDASATGLKLDLSNLALENSALAVGLDVNVTGTSGTRYAALFQGGRVGIGTSLPEADLHVSGDIKATNLLLQGVLQSESATFNNLIVNRHVTVNGTVTINELVVQGTLTANTMVLLSTLTAPDAIFNGVTAQTVSINGLLRTNQLSVLNQLSANSLTVTAGVGIGTTAPSSGLAVSGSVSVTNVSVSDQLSLVTATLNVNNGSLFVGSSESRVGIATTTPLGILHAVSFGSSQYDPSNYLTWNPMVLQNNSYNSGTATGLLFLPDASAPSPNSGSGILAVRSNSLFSDPASHLVFVTDPQETVGLAGSGTSAERMRITAAGNVGIGTQAPTSLLHVAGTMTVAGNATVNGTLYVSTITGSGNITLAPSGTVVMRGLVSANAGVRLSESLQLAPVAAQSVNASFGQLYVDSNSLDLYYLKPGSSTPFNISVAHSGVPGKVPFFDSSGNLSDTATLYWDVADQRFQIGTANSLASMSLVATFNNTNAANFTGQTISLGFDDRSAASGGASFTGLAINLEGQQGSAFGRLAPNERAVGLLVDVSKLQTKQFSQENVPLAGTKYAAVFTGGSVGVGLTSPAAALHVRSETSGMVPFRVDTNLISEAFVVDALGRVGIGTGNMSLPAQLSVVGQSGLPVLNVLTSTGTSSLFVSSTGAVGVGTTTPGAALTVLGTVSANTGLFESLTAATMNIGNGAFVVDEVGNIGVGTTAPAANIAFRKIFTPDNVADIPEEGYISQVMNLGIGVSQQDTTFLYKRNLTGIQVALGSDSSSAVLGDANPATPVSATGVSVNMASLNLASDAKAVGLSVDVTGTSGTRYAALFQGGNVGVGVTAPTVALDVSGDIRATSAFLSGSVSAETITVNRLTVNGPGVTILSGTVTVNTLVADIISANRVILQKELVVSTASFTTVNATSVAYFGTLGVGVSNPSAMLDVDGDAAVSGLLTVSNLNVSTIQSSGTLGLTASTINMSGSLTLASELNLTNGGLYLSAIADPVLAAGPGILYVSNTDGSLRYNYPDGSSSVNLSRAFYGTSGRIPFFGADNNLTSSAYLNWDPTSQSLKIGTGNVVSSLEIASTLNVLSVGDIAAQRIVVDFADRSALTGQSSVFTGLDIRFQSQNPNDASNFGRLAAGETAVGLDVDVRNLKAAQNIGGLLTSGYKYAAVFKGGNVGIGISRPEAALHILDEAGNMPFKVETQTTKNMLVVTNAGLVGIGTSVPSAALTVVGPTGAQSRLFEVKDDTLLTRMVVMGDGKVGVGTTAPSTTFEVAGIVSANQGVFNSLLATTANIANGGFFVNESGNVGVGTTLPTAGWHLSRRLTESIADDYVGEKMQLQVGTNQENVTFKFNKNITGLDVSVGSIGSSILEGVSTTLNATGVSINMTGLVMSPVLTTATGLFVDVTGTSGTRYSGIFMGGNLGIGTESPVSALHVSGDITAAGLILSGDLVATSVTTNRLAVLGSSFFDGPVTVNTLVADTVSANNIILTGTFTVSTGSFTTVNATTAGNFGKVGIGIGTAIPSEALEVIGNVAISGNMIVEGALTVATINSQSGSLFLNAASGVSVFGDMTVNQNLRITNGGMYFKTLSAAPAVDATRGLLYADADGHLNYLRPTFSAPITLTRSLVGPAGAIPFYDGTGNLSGSANVVWNAANNRLSVGTANQMTSFEVLSTIPNLLGESFTGQSIQLSFGDRVPNGTSSTKMTGLNILFSGQNPNDPNSFGRLAQGEEGIGLMVDLRDVRGRYSSEEPLDSDTNFNGFKYAGLFLGGNVGVGTSSPRAAMHVVSSVSTVQPFRVDAEGRDYSMVISGDGAVGIGTSAPGARLDVLGSAADSSSFAFLLRNSENAPILAARNDRRVGIGTTTPAATLTVSGNIPFAVSVPSNTNALFMNTSGLLGLNQAAPQSILDVVGTSGTAPFRVGVQSVNDYALFVATTGFVGMGVSSPKNRLHVDGIVQSGTENAVVPSWIQAGGTAIKGYLAGDSKSVFFGMVPNGAVYDSVVYWDTPQFRFQFSDGATTVNVATLVAATGVGPKMGIGTIMPSANLHVTSNLTSEPVFRVDAYQKLGSLMVSGNGYVGINTLTPAYPLDVNGDAQISGVFTVPTANISTVNVTGYLAVSRLVSTQPAATVNAQEMQVTLNNYSESSLIGLNINLSSATNPVLNTPYSVFGSGRATGLFVDVSGISVLNPAGSLSTVGYKYAGLFLGGNVGIGTTQPAAPLHINTTLTDAGDGSLQGDVARFGSSSGDLTIRDYGTGRVGFVMKNANTNVSYLSLVLAPGTGASDTPGRVGIGVSNPDKTLVVNGDMRVGAWRESSVVENPAEPLGRYGAKLYFNGGPDISPIYDSENNAPMWISRYNASATSSDLRINVGTQSSNGHRFVVGTGGETSFKPILNVQMDGKVGISDLSQSETFTPRSVLHVVGGTAATAEYLENHVVAFENRAGSGGDILALQFTTANALNETYNFVSFFDNTATWIGGIKSNTDGTGVQFVTGGADYAEYLEKSVLSEVIQPGDVVGVVNGKISKNTEGAQLIMVRSTSPSIAGNKPAQKDKNKYELIAFLGQVPVRVRGTVRTGDYLIPSGQNDGVAIAVSPAALTTAQRRHVLGTAWASADGPGVHLVKTAVGFAFDTPSYDQELQLLATLKSDVNSLKKSQDKLIQDYEARFAAQDKEIDRLISNQSRSR